MTRKTTTVMLDDATCGAGSAHTVEKALRDVPGVLRAYVNPATEVAYVEYDADRCAEDDLAKAVESTGVHAVGGAGARDVTRLHVIPERSPMLESRARSRSWWAFAGFIAIAGFLLLTEHRAHLFGALPFLLLLACPFLHMFGHGGHGGHGNHDSGHDDDRRRPAGHHHHDPSDTPSTAGRGRETS